MWRQAWHTSCCQGCDASCHSALLQPSCHTANMVSPLASLWGWQDLVGRKRAITLRCDLTANLINPFCLNSLLHYELICKKNIISPFLWNAFSDEEVSGEQFPSIIHLKRDCWLPRSFMAPGPPTTEPPRSRPVRFTPEPNPEEKYYKGYFVLTHM